MNNQSKHFFILGAQKAGTTTLHNWLAQNKQIDLPDIKETHYFSYKNDKGIEWYLNHFKNKGKIKGEIDPSYLFCKSAARNIKKYIDNPKLIILLRKPIDRAYSHYLMSKFRGLEKKSFLDAIRNEPRIINKSSSNYLNFSYLSRGEYVEQINNYKKYFNNSKIYFIKFDNIIKKSMQQSVYGGICKYLEIDNIKINYDVDKNTTNNYKSRFVSNLLYKKNILRDIFNYLVKSDLKKNNFKNKINKLNSNILLPQDKMLKRDVMNNMDDKYKLWNNKEVKDLESITNLDLKDWIL